MELTPDEEYVVTCGIDGTMFILKVIRGGCGCIDIGECFNFGFSNIFTINKEIQGGRKVFVFISTQILTLLSPILPIAGRDR